MHFPSLPVGGIGKDPRVTGLGAWDAETIDARNHKVTVTNLVVGVPIAGAMTGGQLYVQGNHWNDLTSGFLDGYWLDPNSQLNVSNVMALANFSGGSSNPYGVNFFRVGNVWYNYMADYAWCLGDGSGNRYVRIDQGNEIPGFKNLIFYYPTAIGATNFNTANEFQVNTPAAADSVSVGSNGVLKANLGMASAATNDLSSQFTATGITNANAINIICEGVTGTSGYRSNTVSGLNWSLGTVTVPTSYILQPNDAIVFASGGAKSGVKKF